MAPRKPDAPPVTSFFSQSQNMLGMIPLIAPQAERFWQAQKDILGETETFSRHWFERRHTATRTALETAKDISANGSSDPVHAMRSVAEWQKQSMERIAEDTREWFDFCARCAGRFGRAELEAGEDSLEEIAKSAKPTKREKDDVPV